MLRTRPCAYLAVASASDDKARRRALLRCQAGQRLRRRLADVALVAVHPARLSTPRRGHRQEESELPGDPAASRVFLLAWIPPLCLVGGMPTPVIGSREVG